MNRNLDKTVDYLMASDINTLPLGKVVIDRDRMFLQVTEARTRQLTDENYEVHRDYIDIQIDIEGCEVIETALDGVTLIGEYQPDPQKATARGGIGERYVMESDRSVLHVIGGAHGPGGCPQELECVKECVAKVAAAGERP